jgi:hypothetical protein
LDSLLDTINLNKINNNDEENYELLTEKIDHNFSEKNFDFFDSFLNTSDFICDEVCL